MNSLSLDVIRAALDCIPADLPRDEWVRIAMALKSELGEAGLELFDAWSKKGAKYNGKSIRDTWRSVKVDGGVGIGTLLHMAKAYGFRWDERDSKTQPTPGEWKARPTPRAEREKDERAEREAANRQAAKEAEKFWREAAKTGESRYLVRKGVRGHGVRYGSQGWLIVPMRDAGGALWNVQRIAPSKPSDGPDKLFLKGGRKSGLFHWCGDPAKAPVLLIAEGYATAASIHEATGRPVAVAFDAGNLGHVARILRRQNRRALLVLCADNDRETEHKTGHNPGRDKATEAAKAVAGVVALPPRLPDGGSDFNDMSLHAGADAVRGCIEGAIAEALSKHEAASHTRTHPELGTGVLDRFSVNDEGVWFTEHDNEGRPKAPLWICTRLEVPALTRDADGQGWGYLLEFSDPAGVSRQWAMPARMLAGDGAEFRSVLLALGLRIAGGARARSLLTQYIQTRRPSEHARCTDRIGWHSHAFVLPHETLGDAGERIVFQTDGAAENTLRQRGTLDGWREHVARHCVGNSRLVFAVSCAFAGPILRHAGMDSGGFHLRGDSSNGKTTALRVGASVYGGASFVQRWRATDNALEAIAAQHSDLLLILDELAQVDPKVAGECAYMLANETSKARSTRTGQARPRLTWRLLFLSAGEVGLAAHMAQVGKRVRAGQDLRMAEVPADAGAGLGIFEELNGHENAAALAHHLSKACEWQHGTAGHAFLQWAVSHADVLRDRTTAAIDRLAGLWVPEGASGQVGRVARRFALVAAAGELATEAGITGWPEGEATGAARRCFNSWLESRGGIGDAEEVQMLRQVRRFFEAHAESRLTEWNRLQESFTRTQQRAGFRKPIKDEGLEIVAWEFYVFIEAFRQEICEGFEYKAVLRVLKDHGYLEPDTGRSFDCRARLPNLGLTRCYRIKSAILDDTAGE